MFPLILTNDNCSNNSADTDHLNKKDSRRIILGSTLINMLVTLAIFLTAILSGGISISEQYTYIGSFGVSFGLRINTISMVLLIMSSVVLFALHLQAIGRRSRQGSRPPSSPYFQMAAVGLFTSANLFVFFIFWDIGVVALFFMINTLGSANRKLALINCLSPNMARACVLLFLGIIVIYISMRVHSFDIATITDQHIAHTCSLPQAIIFLVLFVAFMVNMRLEPMHFWLPDTHTEGSSTQGCCCCFQASLQNSNPFGMFFFFSSMLRINRILPCT